VEDCNNVPETLLNTITNPLGGPDTAVGLVRMSVHLIILPFIHYH